MGVVLTSCYQAHQITLQNLQIMGNIISYFFPQPAPPSIEKVEEVVQDENITEKVPEKTVAPKLEDAPVVEELNSSDLVPEKEIEPETPTDEGFEVVENTSLSEISNSVTQAEPENNTTKDETPVPAFNNDKETSVENETDTTLEPSVNAVRVEMSEATLAVNNPPCIYAQTSNSPPADVEVIGSIQDENVKAGEKEMITEPEKATISEPQAADETEPEETMVIPEPIKAALNHELLEPVKMKEDTPEEPEKCFGPDSNNTILTEVIKEQTPEPSEDLPELIKLATELVKVSSPEVEVIGSVSDIGPEQLAEMYPPSGSSFCGTADPSNLRDYEAKEDSPAIEAPVKAATPEVELPKDVSGGVEGLKDILTESKLQDYEVKEDSPVTEAPVKAASLEDELSRDTSAGVEGLKAVLTESSKIEE